MNSKVIRIQPPAGHKPSERSYVFGEFRMDPVQCSLAKGSHQIPIAPKVFETLLVLVENRDRVVPKEELIRTIWPNTVVEESNLTQNIFLLRKILGQRANERFILTAPGKGYRFIAGVQELDRGDVAPSKAEPTAPSPTKFSWMALVAGLGLLAILAGFAYWLSARPAASRAKPPESRFLTSLPGCEVQPAISPDSKRVAFSWNGEKEDNFDIYVKEIGAEAPQRLTTGAAEEGSPAWSPDGSRIAFVRLAPVESGVYVIPASGGPERRVAPIYASRLGVEGRHLDWSRNGQLLAVSDKMTDKDALSLFVLDAETGARRRLTEPPARSTSDIAPRFSPDGRRIAFVRCTARIVRDVYVIPITGGQPQRITYDNRWIGDVDWTPDGRELIFSSERGGIPTLWRVNAPEKPAKPAEPQPLSPTAENALYVSIARSGNRLVYSQSITDINIWKLDLPESAGTAPSWTKLIASTRDDSNPEYSPDGKQIAFRSDRSGVRTIWIAGADGKSASPVPSMAGAVASAAWSPDGQQLTFDAYGGRSYDIYVASLNGGPARRLTVEDSEDVLPRWSPDGQFVYFSSNRSGEWQIWRVPAAGGKAEQITKYGGFAARPSYSGDEIYYSKGMTFPGIWTAPAAGGEERRLLEMPKPEYWTLWAVTKNGIYFMDGQAPGVPPPPKVMFFDFATRKIKTVAEAVKPLYLLGVYNLSVSSDGRSLITAQLDQASSDLVTVDGYR